jgi:hypothetical protein
VSIAAVILASGIAFFSSIAYYLQYLYQYSFLCEHLSAENLRAPLIDSAV